MKLLLLQIKTQTDLKLLPLAEYFPIWGEGGVWDMSLIVHLLWRSLKFSPDV